METTFTYPKPIMKMSALIDMGFPEEFLLYAYRNPRQTFAHKMNPTKKNSPILFDTAGFEAWRQKLIKTETQSMQRGGQADGRVNAHQPPPERRDLTAPG